DGEESVEQIVDTRQRGRRIEDADPLSRVHRPLQCPDFFQPGGINAGHADGECNRREHVEDEARQRSRYSWHGEFPRTGRTSLGRPPQAAARTSCTFASATFSATMMVGMLVLPRGSVGMMDASTTRNPAKPRSWPVVSTTAMRSLGAPMRQVPTG